VSPLVTEDKRKAIRNKEDSIMIKQLTIRVQVADDHPVVRDGLTATINYQPDMKVVAKSANGIEALEHYRTFKPDVTLMDLRMPEMDGVTAIAAIRAEFPQARIIVLTTYDGDEGIYKGLIAGAVGYLLKDTPLAEVLKAIRNVFKQRPLILPNVTAKTTDSPNDPQMTERELEVLSLLARGYSNQAIGSALFIVEGTVKTHVTNICDKLVRGDRALDLAKVPAHGIPHPG
jgi:two-component system NarL family response regulator